MLPGQDSEQNVLPEVQTGRDQRECDTSKAPLWEQVLSFFSCSLEVVWTLQVVDSEIYAASIEKPL